MDLCDEFRNFWQEEHPPIIPNFGMGSILVNYYRKKDDKDDYMPKVRVGRLINLVRSVYLLQLDLGVPFVLEPQDESPFMKFGYVYPGQTFPALYNNLVRAPLFRHKPYPTDFLVVRYEPFFPLYLMYHSPGAQEHPQGGDEVLSARDQKLICDRPDLPSDRSPGSSLPKDYKHYQT